MPPEESGAQILSPWALAQFGLAVNPYKNGFRAGSLPAFELAAFQRKLVKALFERWRSPGWAGTDAPDVRSLAGSGKSMMNSRNSCATD